MVCGRLAMTIAMAMFLKCSLSMEILFTLPKPVPHL